MIADGGGISKVSDFEARYNASDGGFKKSLPPKIVERVECGAILEILPIWGMHNLISPTIFIK